MNYDKKLKAAERLLEVMDTLREKCPWDREQTIESLRNNTKEETYELADAIADNNMEVLRRSLATCFCTLSSTQSWARSRVYLTLPM